MGLQGRFSGPECTFVLPEKKKKNYSCCFLFSLYICNSLCSSPWQTIGLLLAAQKLHSWHSLHGERWDVSFFLSALVRTGSWARLCGLHFFPSLYQVLFCFLFFFADLNMWQRDASLVGVWGYLVNVQCGSLIVFMVCLAHNLGSLSLKVACHFWNLHM